MHAALRPFVYSEARLASLVGPDGLDLPETGTLLDVGCGDGAFALAIGVLRPRLRLCGLDADPVQAARARALGLPVQAEMIEAGGGLFDIAVARAVAVNTADPADFAAAVGRRVRARGMVGFVEEGSARFGHRDDAFLAARPDLHDVLREGEAAIEASLSTRGWGSPDAAPRIGDWAGAAGGVPACGGWDATLSWPDGGEHLRRALQIDADPGADRAESELLAPLIASPALREAYREARARWAAARSRALANGVGWERETFAVRWARVRVERPPSAR